MLLFIAWLRKQIHMSHFRCIRYSWNIFQTSVLFLERRIIDKKITQSMNIRISCNRKLSHLVKDAIYLYLKWYEWKKLFELTQFLQNWRIIVLSISANCWIPNNMFLFSLWNVCYTWQGRQTRHEKKYVETKLFIGLTFYLH